jgi:hypothetical protein
MKDKNGGSVASGLYLYRVTSGDESKTGRVAVVR